MEMQLSTSKQSIQSLRAALIKKGGNCNALIYYFLIIFAYSYLFPLYSRYCYFYMYIYIDVCILHIFFLFLFFLSN
ncbi:hypothetical protein I7I48_10273 [Histoplasma ohiense]|nr:hypothetical protein I7I48_10273 [Histoplasma ohiense (nom. inval.)]